MRRASMLVLLLLVAAGCGGGGTKTSAAGTPTTIEVNRSAPPAVRVLISASHTVKARAKWPVTIHVTDASGNPVSGTLTMNILLGGMPVGNVDNGKTWRFTGSWHEPRGQEIIWPAQARGTTFGFQAVVHARGRTVKKTFAPVLVR
jgi:hypothetical protein